MELEETTHEAIANLASERILAPESTEIDETEARIDTVQSQTVQPSQEHLRLDAVARKETSDKDAQLSTGVRMSLALEL